MRTALVVIPLALIGCFEDYGNGRDSGREPDAIVDVDGADIINSDQECDEVTGDIRVTANGELEDAPDDACWDLIGTLTLQGPNVTSLASLRHLRTVAVLEIKDTNLVALDPHRTIEVLLSLSVEGNSRLTSLQGLRIVETDPLPVSLVLRDNPALTGLGDVAQVRTLTSSLVVEETGLVEAAFPALESTLLVSFIDNEELATVELPVLDELDDLIVDKAPALTTLSLPALDTITSMRIDDADALTSFDDFQKLEDITGSLVIQNNARLGSLGDLQDLDAIGIGAAVRRNPMLSTCLVAQLDQCADVVGTIVNEDNLAATCPPTVTCPP